MKIGILMIVPVFLLSSCSYHEKYEGAPSAYGWPLQRLPFVLVPYQKEESRLLDLRELLIREVIAFDAENNDNFWYIDFYNGPSDYMAEKVNITDPPDEFMSRFSDSKVPVRKISEAWRKNWAITDQTGELWVPIIFMQIEQLTEQDKVKVIYGSYTDASGGWCRTAVATFKDGEWHIEKKSFTTAFWNETYLSSNRA